MRESSVRNRPKASRIGCSLVVGPEASPVAQAAYGEDAEALRIVEVSPVIHR
ncbi:MAG TPA: hypothetical protein VFD27_08970 [Chthoniobacteraceae bacterium]|nr:hypothetical protein [Chthoniobacteraceae bacterium]